ncbi:MAG: PASTA domain-containing protein [Clostridia bacterium]|nr:PASTA domain-containing protein [Clostridia bacterium]
MKRWWVLLPILCLLAGCGGQEPTVRVPDLAGVSVEEAQTALTACGLVAVVKHAPSAETAGTVLHTDPPAGTHTAAGGKVYLFVAADAAATTTATVSATTTTATVVASASLSTSHQTRPTTFPPPASTSVSPISTVTEPASAAPCEAGHAYTEGVCSRCGAADANYVPTFAVGETWTVAGQWSFTLLEAVRHSCSGNEDGALLLRYRYTNLGFNSDLHGLCIDGDVFAVTDGQGKAAALYPCPHKRRPQVCTVGEACTAEEVYAVAYDGDLTLTVFFLTSNGNGIARARFVVSLP